MRCKDEGLHSSQSNKQYDIHNPIGTIAPKSHRDLCCDPGRYCSHNRFVFCYSWETPNLVISNIKTRAANKPAQLLSMGRYYLSLNLFLLFTADGPIPPPLPNSSLSSSSCPSGCHHTVVCFCRLCTCVLLLIPSPSLILIILDNKQMYPPPWEKHHLFHSRLLSVLEQIIQDKSCQYPCSKEVQKCKRTKANCLARISIPHSTPS